MDVDLFASWCRAAVSADSGARAASEAELRNVSEKLVRGSPGDLLPVVERSSEAETLSIASSLLRAAAIAQWEQRRPALAVPSEEQQLAGRRALEESFSKLAQELIRVSLEKLRQAGQAPPAAGAALRMGARQIMRCAAVLVVRGLALRERSARQRQNPDPFTKIVEDAITQLDHGPASFNSALSFLAEVAQCFCGDSRQLDGLSRSEHAAARADFEGAIFVVAGRALAQMFKLAKNGTRDQWLAALYPTAAAGADSEAALFCPRVRAVKIVADLAPEDARDTAFRGKAKLKAVDAWGERFEFCEVLSLAAYVLEVQGTVSRFHREQPVEFYSEFLDVVAFYGGVELRDSEFRKSFSNNSTNVAGTLARWLRALMTLLLSAVSNRSPYPGQMEEIQIYTAHLRNGIHEVSEILPANFSELLLSGMDEIAEGMDATFNFMLPRLSSDGDEIVISIFENIMEAVCVIAKKASWARNITVSDAKAARFRKVCANFATAYLTSKPEMCTLRDGPNSESALQPVGDQLPFPGESDSAASFFQTEREVLAGAFVAPPLTIAALQDMAMIARVAAPEVVGGLIPAVELCWTRAAAADDANLRFRHLILFISYFCFDTVVGTTHRAALPADVFNKLAGGLITTFVTFAEGNAAGVLGLRKALLAEALMTFLGRFLACGAARDAALAPSASAVLNAALRLFFVAPDSPAVVRGVLAGILGPLSAENPAFLWSNPAFDRFLLDLARCDAGGAADLRARAPPHVFQNFFFVVGRATWPPAAPEDPAAAAAELSAANERLQTCFSALEPLRTFFVKYAADLGQKAQVLGDAERQLVVGLSLLRGLFAGLRRGDGSPGGAERERASLEWISPVLTHALLPIAKAHGASAAVLSHALDFLVGVGRCCFSQEQFAREGTSALWESFMEECTILADVLVSNMGQQRAFRGEDQLEEVAAAYRPLARLLDLSQLVLGRVPLLRSGRGAAGGDAASDLEKTGTAFTVSAVLMTAGAMDRAAVHWRALELAGVLDGLFASLYQLCEQGGADVLQLAPLTTSASALKTVFTVAEQSYRREAKSLWTVVEGTTSLLALLIYRTLCDPNSCALGAQVAQVAQVATCAIKALTAVKGAQRSLHVEVVCRCSLLLAVLPGGFSIFRQFLFADLVPSAATAALAAQTARAQLEKQIAATEQCCATFAARAAVDARSGEKSFGHFSTVDLRVFGAQQVAPQLQELLHAVRVAAAVR